MQCVKLILLAMILKNSYQSYVIPTPEIIVYNSSGFSVSIPHVPGISSLAFYGNVNRKLVGFSVGEILKKVEKPEDGRWVLRDHDIKLSMGDVIYYRLIVIKNNLGYVLDDGRFEVKVIGELTKNRDTRQLQPGNNHSNPFIARIANLTHTLVQQKAKIGALKVRLRRMKDYIEQRYGGRKLTVSGELPSSEHVFNSVAMLLRKRLRLKIVIVSAEKNSDGSITFEVPSVEDKLHILETAKRRLKDSIVFKEV